MDQLSWNLDWNFIYFRIVTVYIFIKQFLHSYLKFERDIIGKSNWLIIQQQCTRLYTRNAHVCVNVFLAVALPNSSTKSRKLVAITSSNNETQFPRFPCNYLVEQKATVAGFYCLTRPTTSYNSLIHIVNFSPSIFTHMRPCISIPNRFTNVSDWLCVYTIIYTIHRYYPPNKSPFTNIILFNSLRSHRYFFLIEAAIVSTKKEISLRNYFLSRKSVK